MNDAQRQKIIQLRQAGQSFAQIADKVCLPKSTVKSFCYRHTASADDVKQEPRSTFCPQCGKPLPNRRFKPRRFCSDECRAKYWAAHGDQIVRRSAVDMTCPVCTGIFTITPSDTESIAATPAISPPGIMEGFLMTKEQFRRELLFRATMRSVEQLRSSGVLTDSEYEKCREIMLRKYEPPIGKIVLNRSESY